MRTTEVILTTRDGGSSDPKILVSDRVFEALKEMAIRGGYELESEGSPYSARSSGEALRKQSFHIGRKKQYPYSVFENEENYTTLQRVIACLQLCKGVSVASV